MPKEGMLAAPKDPCQATQVQLASLYLKHAPECVVIPTHDCTFKMYWALIETMLILNV